MRNWGGSIRKLDKFDNFLKHLIRGGGGFIIWVFCFMYFLITVYTNKLTKTFCKLKQITVIDLFETAELLLSIYLFLVLKKLRPTFLERY